MDDNIILLNEEVQLNDEIPNQLVFDSVYSFVSGLPYSMDPKNEEYIPADLYNHMPTNNSLIKNPMSDLENVSLFLELQSWGDTRRTAYVIQLCCLFQMMLRYNIKLDFNTNNEMIEVWGVSPEYQELINNILKTFPGYLEKIQNSLANEERNLYLVQVYEEIKKAFNRFKPKGDLEMYYYFNNIEYKMISLEKIEEKHLIGVKKKVLSLNIKDQVNKNN